MGIAEFIWGSLLYGCYNWIFSWIFNFDSNLSYIKKIFTLKFLPFYIFILLFSCNYHTKELPIYGRPEIIENKTNNGISYDTIPHSVENFQFINQDSMVVTNSTFSNSIYIADFFFHNMSYNMSSNEKQYDKSI